MGLAGLRVLELGSLASASWCARLFADFGGAIARVKRVEPTTTFTPPLSQAIVLNDGGEKQQEIVKLLLDNGANPHMTDKYGKTPLELAREKGFDAIADLLLAAGA